MAVGTGRPCNPLTRAARGNTTSIYAGHLKLCLAVTGELLSVRWNLRLTRLVSWLWTLEYHDEIQKKLHQLQQIYVYMLLEQEGLSEKVEISNLGIAKKGPVIEEENQLMLVYTNGSVCEADGVMTTYTTRIHFVCSSGTAVSHSWPFTLNLIVAIYKIIYLKKL